MPASSPPARSRKGLRFWLVLAGLIVSLFLAILEVSAMAPALPTIVQDIHGTQFLWVADAYGLTSAALVPLSGSLSEIFGRRPMMLLALFLFGAGSAIGGAAQNVNMLIAARAVQGAGAGGIYSLSQIILSDIVTLEERGTYSGLFGLTWALAGGIGPVIGGSLAKQTTWRWLLYMNIPIAGFSFLLVLTCLKLPTPPGTLREKIRKIDFIGQIIVIGSTTSCIISLVWGGVVFPWASARVLVPLVVGLTWIVIFVIFEVLWCPNPIVPLEILSNRTSISGYAQTFLCSFIFSNLIFYLPVYYQACKDASPMASGIDVFGLAFTTAPVSVLSGVSVTISRRYRPQLWSGWVIAIVGFGLLSLVRENTSRATSIGFQMISGAGLGLIYYTAFFPVLAPLPVTLSAHALSFSMYLRALSQVWAITIGGAILQNGLLHRLPASFNAHFNNGAGIAYSVVPQIPALPQPLKNEVRSAFARSFATLWIVLLALSCLGLAVSLPMKGITLYTARKDGRAMGNTDDQRRPDGPSVQTDEDKVEHQNSVVYGVQD